MICSIWFSPLNANDADNNGNNRPRWAMCDGLPDLR